jgi:hypothetical protein
MAVTALKKYLGVIPIVLVICATALADQTDVQSNLQQAIAARYRLTSVGPSAFGLRGADDTIRKMGGTLLIVKKGLFGSQERRDITSNSIKNGERTLLSGKDDIELLPGQRFFATSVSVGQDFVSVGILTVDPHNFQGHMGRVWAALNFFFDPQVISSGNLNKINAVMDQWILPADSLPTASAPTLAARVTSPALAPSIELKAGATREEIETGLGKPTQAIAFGNKTWLTYPALVAVLEDGKLVSVDRTEQMFGNLSLKGHGGAEIYVDGELAGTTPTTLRVPTGSHKVELKLDGKNVWDQQVRVFPGADVNLDPAF